MSRTIMFALLLLSPFVTESPARAQPPAGAPVAVDASEDPRRAARAIARETLDPRSRALIARPDRKRPEKQLSVPIFGRPLTIGGRYQALLEYEEDKLLDFDFFDTDNRDIDGDGDVTELEDEARGKRPLDDQLRFDQELQLDFFYPFTDSISVYTEMQLNWNNLVRADFESENDEWFGTLKESWLMIADILDSPVGLQVGRQRYFDEREWWWDDNQDALRLRADGETFHFGLGVAQRLLPTSTNRPYPDPAERDVLRFFGEAIWEWAPRHRVALHALHHRDSSSAHALLPAAVPCVRDRDMDGTPDPIPMPFFERACIDPRDEDESDADLTWFGVSANGRWKPEDSRRFGRIYYWLEAAGVIGVEDFTDFSGADFERRVASIDRNHVAGMGLDVGTTWQGEGSGHPSVTLGYAYGSGKRGTRKEKDRGFRQTGLQDNNDRFRGVASFRYYGVLFDPELSNLHVFTLGTGLRFLQQSSLDFVYHYYRQAHAAAYLRDVGFKRDPVGLDPGLGHEWDVILGIEDFEPFEIRLLGSIFRTGPAFALPSPRLSYLTSLRVRVNF